MDEQSAALELTKLINGFQVSQVIHVAAMLRVPDLLKDRPVHSAEIAAATGTHPRSMYRLLHALASVGVLEERVDEQFSLTALGECLRSDSPHSRAAWARNIGRPYAWEAWGDMLQCVLSGEDAFRRTRGKRVWEWRADQPEETAFFDAAMTELSHGIADAITDAVDFSRFRCIVDIGGGQGEFLAGVLAKNPGSRGILYDLPHVVSGAPSVMAAHGVTERCDIMDGACLHPFRTAVTPMSSRACCLTKRTKESAPS
jgi:O-methyltransferase domain/Dimerisation domain